MKWPFNYWISPEKNTKIQRQAAIDEAVRRCISCPGLSLKESAQVMMRNMHLLPELMFPLIRDEYLKIMKSE